MISMPLSPSTVKVRLQVPQGHEVQKLTNRQAVVNIYIGQHEGRWAVQLNGQLVQPADIRALIEEQRGGLSPENQQRLTVSLRVDRKAPMGLVSQVKHELQQAYALKINYNATEIKK